MTRTRLVLIASCVAVAVSLTAGCVPEERAQASAPAPSESARRQPSHSASSDPTPSDPASPPATPSMDPTQETQTPTTPPAKPPILQRGDTGTKVRELQVRLGREDLYDAGIDGVYGPKTEQAVRDFQERQDIPATGAVDEQTWDELVELTGTVKKSDMFPPPPAEPAASLDERCLVGRVICADKTHRKLSWVIDGKVQFSMDARFGRASLPTTNGVHEIYWKDRDHVSSIYEAKMPFSLFFHGGEAVHYSYEFKSLGYGGPGGSHGCINTRNWELTERLFSEAEVGDKVVVYGEY